MCQNVIDGRYYTECGHFFPMSTAKEDCLRPNCLFSQRHAHPIGCRSPHCIRTMSLPKRNPIRLSNMKCPDCRAR
ncbi:hypothetical protein K435DRAFT_728075, partial [Dendrothele bispora CBS 962.96]